MPFLLSKIKTILLVVLGLEVYTLYYLFGNLPDGLFHVYFLDVGQGDSTFIHTPCNNQIIIDGGPDDTVIYELAKIMPFFDRSIDLMVLSHPHADHLNGLLSIIERFTIDNVLISGVLSTDSAYLEFLETLDDSEINVFIANADQTFAFCDVTLEVIYPLTSIELKSYENLNNSSVVMKVQYLDQEILMTGDIEQEVENKLLESGADLNSDILKSAHHGSKTSSGLEFLSKVKPEVAVVSAGKNNSYGHPHPETLKNLEISGVSKIYKTEQYGTIEFAF